jgi:hypothetical protein
MLLYNCTVQVAETVSGIAAVQSLLVTGNVQIMRSGAQPPALAQLLNT